jgi:leucyl aminopeptidase
MRMLTLLAALMVSAPATAAPSEWITAGEAAYKIIRKALPGIVARDSRVAGGASMEKVYLLAVKKHEVDRVARMLHRELRHCGGFMYHAGEAEGRQALSDTAGTAPPAQTRPTYVIASQALVSPILVEMQDAHLRQTIADLSAFTNRYYSTDQGAAASDWLKEKWTGLAAQQSHISITQYSHTSYRQRSVIATIRGSDKAAEVVVLGAHLDSINIAGSSKSARAPGADDDASGVAGLTEVLRVIAAGGYQPRRTIKLIGYAAEEVGLRGSQDIAREHKKNGVNVVGVMQLDMINFKGSESDIYIFSDYTDSLQNDFLARLIKTYLPTLTIGYDKCGYGCSDHASWTAQGYAASMPFESAMSEDNPHIHTARDTFANSGEQALHALKFARLAAAFAIELGSER